MTSPVKKLIQHAKHHKTLRQWGLRAYALKNPPPYRRPNMEFDLDIWNGISSLHGQDGRQIGENNAAPHLYKEDIPTEHKTFKFGGSRAGLPVNMTALRHVLAVWDDSLQLATLLRNRYIEHRGLSDTRFTLRNAYLYSKLGTAMAAYLVRRQVNPVRDGQLAPLECAFFTLGVGPFMVLRAQIQKGDISGLTLPPQTPEAYYEVADSSGSLVTPAGKGCAGSPKLIKEFLDVVMNGTYAKPLTSANALRVMESIEPWSAFYGYGLSASRLELLVKSAQTVCARSLLALRSQGAIATQDQAIVEAALEHSYYCVEPDGDHATILANIATAYAALIEEHDDSATVQQMQEAGLLEVSDVRTPADAAHKIRAAIDLLFPMCDRDLRAMHLHLGRPDWGRISRQDFLHRVGGPGIETLLARLDAASPRSVAIKAAL